MKSLAKKKVINIFLLTKSSINHINDRQTLLVGLTDNTIKEFICECVENRDSNNLKNIHFESKWSQLKSKIHQTI